MNVLSCLRERQVGLVGSINTIGMNEYRRDIKWYGIDLKLALNNWVQYWLVSKV